MRTIQKNFKKATGTRKGRIILLGIAVLVVLGISGAVLYWKIYRKKIIRNEIERMVRNKSNGLYTLTYDSLKLDEVAGNLAISGITLTFDSLKYEALAQQNNAPPTLIRLTIPEIVVWGVQTPRALLSKQIVGKKLAINKPAIQIIYTNAGNDSAKHIPPNEVYRQLLGNLELIRIDTLEINGADIVTSNLKSGKKGVTFKNTSLHLFDIELDEKKPADTSRILFARQITVASEEISFRSDERPYNYVFDSVTLNSINSSGTAKKIRIIPLLGENAFVKSLPAQDDRFDFSLSNTRLINLNIPELFNEKILADSVIIATANFKIYRDLSIPRDSKNRVGSYPHQLLQKLPVIINARKLVIAGAFIEYKEKNAISGYAGKVQFHKTYALLTNITNDKNAVKENNVMTATVNTRFLDLAPLNTEWRFYLQNPRGRFSLKGSLGSIAVKNVNRLTEPMGPAKMESGHIQSLSFNLEANNYTAGGTVKMLYKDLKLSLLEKDKGSKVLDRKSVASFVANIVVKNNNPSKDKDVPRVMEVRFERDTNRSIFHLVWKTIFKGIKETVGIKK